MLYRRSRIGTGSPTRFRARIEVKLDTPKRDELRATLPVLPDRFFREMQRFQADPFACTQVVQVIGALDGVVPRQQMRERIHM